jgi:flavin-dependent dehydrogenase
MLVDAAIEAGVRVHGGAKLRPTRREDDEWRLEFEDAEGRRALAAGFLVDATGRASASGRSQGAVAEDIDSMVGVSAFPQLEGTSTDTRFYTMAEATKNGWWYTALLPRSRFVAVFLTDAEIVQEHKHELTRFWLDELERAPHTRKRVDPNGLVEAPRVVKANNCRLNPSAGAGWLAVGDASLSFDPMSSLGLWHALDSARRGAYAASATLAGDAQAADEYAEEERENFTLHLENLVAVYRKVTRFGDERR